MPASVLLAILLSGAAPVADDPLAPAQSGHVQCFGPDRAAHTCQALTVLKRNPDRSWTTTVTTAPDPTQPLTLEVSSIVVVRDGAVCGTVRREDMLAGRVRYFGRPVPASRALPMLVRLADALGPATGREVCTRFEPGADGLIARGTITGSPQATVPDQTMIWVRPDAGFHVGPAEPKTGGG